NTTVEKPTVDSARLQRGLWIARGRQAWQSWRPELKSDLAGVLVTMPVALLGLLLLLPLAYLYRFYTVSDPLRGPKNYADLNPAAIVSDWGLYQSLKQQDRVLRSLSPV